MPVTRRKKGRTKAGRFAPGHTHSVTAGYRARKTLAGRSAEALAAWQAQEQPADGKPLSRDKALILAQLARWECIAEQSHRYLAGRQLGVSSARYARAVDVKQIASNAIAKYLVLLEETREAESVGGGQVGRVMFGGRWKRSGVFEPAPTFRIVRDDYSAAPHQPLQVTDTSTPESVSTTVDSTRESVASPISHATFEAEPDTYTAVEVLPPLPEPEPLPEPGVLTQWNGQVGSVRSEWTNEVFLLGPSDVAEALMVGMMVQFERAGINRARRVRSLRED
jgi:hypothetical protein